MGPPSLVVFRAPDREFIEKAFGSHPDCLGIIVVKDLPEEYVHYRERLLHLAYKFGTLDPVTSSKYVDAKSNYRYLSTKVSVPGPGTDRIGG